MPWGAAAVAGAMVVGSVIQSDAAQNAASTQANAANQSANTQSQAALQQQQNLLAAGQGAAQQFTPYSALGTTALSNLANNNAYFNNQFSNADLNSNLAPNYAFQLQQGMTGAAQQANATGGLVGGNAQQALNTFGQNYAGTAYQNAFNNYQVQRGNISAQDMAQANLGLAGATGSANAQLGTATNVANLGIGSANAQAAGMTGAANAQAAGIIGQSNAYSSGINNIGAVGYSALQSLNQPYNTSNIMNGSQGTGGFTATPGNSFTLA
jgi:hypothetical protein